MSSRGRFHITKYNLILTSFIALGGLTYGFGFAVFVSSIGQPGFYKDLNLDPEAPRTATILGAINALFTFGAAVGALSQSWLSDRLGRRRAILVASTFTIIGSALTAGAVNYVNLVIVRILHGVGLGMIVCMSPLYIAEIAPPKSRGLLVGFFVMGIGTGYVLAAWISLGTFHATNQTVQWRVPLALCTVFPLIQAVGTIWIPESPRWLIWNDRSQEALVTIQKIHRGNSEADEAFCLAEMAQIQSQVQNDRQYDTSVLAMFRKPSWRKRILVATFLFFANQSTGVLGIGNYAVLIYQDLGLGGDQPILINAIYTTVGVVFAEIFGVLFIDRIGRRRLLLIGFPLVGIVLFIEAFLQRSFVGSDNRGGLIGCVFILFVFILIFDATIQVATNIYISEIWPTALRSRGIGLAWASYFVGAITWITPSALAFKNIGYRLYFVWVGCDVISTVIVYFYVPETAGKSLEEMGDLFGDEVVVHMTPDGHLDKNVEMNEGEATHVERSSA